MRMMIFVVKMLLLYMYSLCMYGIYVVVHNTSIDKMLHKHTSSITIARTKVMIQNIPTHTTVYTVAEAIRAVSPCLEMQIVV
jgi:hypothetical protein